MIRFSRTVSSTSRCPAAGPRRAGRGSPDRRSEGPRAHDPERARGDRRDAPDHPHRRRLAGPVGTPGKPNDSPGATSKSMASTAVKPPNRLVRPRAWMSEEVDAASRPDACAGTGVSGMGGHGTSGPRAVAPSLGRLPVPSPAGQNLLRCGSTPTATEPSDATMPSLSPSCWTPRCRRADRHRAATAGRSPTR